MSKKDNLCHFFSVIHIMKKIFFTKSKMKGKASAEGIHSHKSVVTGVGIEKEKILKKIESFVDLGFDSFKITKEVVDVFQIVKSVCEPYMGKIDQEYLYLTLNGEKSRVVGDPKLLTLLFSELLENAFSFTTQGSVEVSVCKQDGMVMVEVKDTGIGIPAQFLPSAFNTFSQYPSDSAGFGMGLAVCDKIVSRHGGSIVVETKLGKGSIFRVMLPY
jgi:two-component system, NarL family, sensor histidine kinase BarA